jgi:hypothetical protein
MGTISASKDHQMPELMLYIYREAIHTDYEYGCQNHYASIPYASDTSSQENAPEGEAHATLKCSAPKVKKGFARAFGATEQWMEQTNLKRPPTE